MVPRVHVLACGVLAADLRELAGRVPAQVTLDILPGKLHNTPHDLRRRLQERIDAVSAAGGADAIAVAYGICGRGTVGLAARVVPLWIPRVHDCIALFLGSDAAYREQFTREPGTYYVTAGWVEEGMGTGGACADPQRGAWQAQHGADNAAAIESFLGSWKRNYRRAAFIDTGIGDRHHAAVAQRLAAANGWRYEELPGSHALLEALLAGAEDERILHVPPGFTTRFDAAQRRLTASPPGGSSAPLPAAATVGRGEPRSTTAATVRREGLGLGIDAGGTYTDAAIFDWGAGRVLAKAKAPTTPWDYAVGIDAALEQLPAERLRQVSMVSVSTTLATNAIVEGRGQKVGLLLLPPLDDEDIEGHIHHRPVRVVRGRMGIDGAPRAPVDADEIRRVAAELTSSEGVRAFAVAGYASHVNPAHELEVMDLLRRATGLAATGGHEVSSIRNYRVRAETAALNARIVPCLRDLMERLRACLDGRGIGAPLLVVRSDGSLMSLAMARERPVETLLSGPAASVAGARHLCELPEALVIDIGGTTSDTAVLHAGRVRTDPDGATVGHWRTHVRALAVRTLGLGGDSEVRLERHGWQVGPRRATPLCRLGENAPSAAVDRCLAWMEAHRAALTEPAAWTVYARLPTTLPPDARLPPRARVILDALSRGPACGQELVGIAGCLRPAFLDIEPLVEGQQVRSFGFTPTDALHLLGRMAFWDAGTARRFAALLGERAGLDGEATARAVLEAVVRRVARELLMARLSDLTGSRSTDGEHGFVARALLERGLGEKRDDLGVDLRLGRPVIGIGAPAGFFLPEACFRLHTEAVIPADGDVANAIGAIVSGVCVERSAEIRVDERGAYHVAGLPGAPSFGELPAAQAYAETALRAMVADLARQAGAAAPEVSLAARDRVTTVGDGEDLFIGRVLVARATGLPG
jgi:N-methylhydantoinase A/oxoprolinase/acetone carboxylase beta subunit